MDLPLFCISTFLELKSGMTVARISFVKAVLEAVAAELSAIGFSKRSVGILTRPMTSDIAEWIALPTVLAVRPGQVGISPNVGVRHDHLENIFGKLTELEQSTTTTATISRPLGYLLDPPGSRIWFFAPGESLADKAQEIIGAIEASGEPYMQRYSSLPDILRVLEGKLGGPDKIYRIPIAEALLGRRDDARAYVDGHVRSLIDASPASMQYRKFARRIVMALDQNEI